MTNVVEMTGAVKRFGTVTPLLPVGSDGIGALAALTATAATLAALGYLGWSRRDLTV